MASKKGNWQVLLTDTGFNFINCIRTVIDLSKAQYGESPGLKATKDLCDVVKAGQPQVILKGLAKRIAIEAVGKLAQVGAKAEATNPLLKKRDSGSKRMKKKC